MQAYARRCILLLWVLLWWHSRCSSPLHGVVACTRLHSSKLHCSSGSDVDAFTQSEAFPLYDAFMTFDFSLSLLSINLVNLRCYIKIKMLMLIAAALI